MSARINVRQRRGIGSKAELGHRHRKKLHVCFRSAYGKGRSSENFLSRASNATACRIQRVKEGKRICKRPDSDRSPHRDGEGRFDLNRRSIGGGSCLERQAVLQDVSRRALSTGFAREREDARGAERRNKERTAALSPHRTMRYGVVTAFLAISPVHGNLPAHAIARANAIRQLLQYGPRVGSRQASLPFKNKCLGLTAIRVLERPG